MAANEPVGVTPTTTWGVAVTTTGHTVPWTRCKICPGSKSVAFKSAKEFIRHLRDFHCTKEGGSFVCRYGPNRVCPSLPLEGVSDKDYEDHVSRDHVAVDVCRSGNMGPESQASSRNVSPPPPSPMASAMSNEPSVVQDQHKWTIYMSRVNLPAALNDPRLSRRETDFFTKTWGESFEKTIVYPSAHIPKISREHFRKYLKRTAARYSEHTKSSSLAAEPKDDQQDSFPVLQARKYDKYRAELDAIPKIFMHPGFSLENPDTFNAVFPWTQIEGARQGHQGSKRQSSKLLQEKLSHYLDLVEVQIAKQISMRSEAFFEAMTSQDELQEHMAKTCAAIKHLRDKVHSVDTSLAVGPLHVMQLARARSNYVNFYNKLKMMSTVHQTQPTIQLLLSTSEFVGALDLISTTQEVLTQELAGVHSFRHLGPQLAEMVKLIDKMMQEDFIKYATADLNRPLSELDRAMEEDDELFFELTTAQEKLVAIVLGMMRQHKFGFIDVYRDEACVALKAMIKQTVIEAVTEADDIDTEASSPNSLADQMRLLNYKQWMGLLNSVFANLTVIVRRTKSVVDVMQEVTRVGAGYGRIDQSGDSETLFDSAGTNGLPGSPDRQMSHVSQSSAASSVRLSIGSDIDVMLSQVEYLRVSSALREMLCGVCDHAHDRCVKLLMARAKDGFLERLSSHEFVQLSRAVEGFVSTGEFLCGRKSTSLRASLQSQASRFVNRFHEERKTKLSLILDNERWKQADVPAEFQDLVSYIAKTGNLGLPEKKNDLDKKPQEVLVVDGDRYAVVGTVLMLLKMTMEYCQCVDDIPSATPDFLTRVIELLKMFNSRTCQLILGAGALQLVGLKTISTKNLALASRCLQLVVHYIPKVKHHFEERLQGKQVGMLKHFEHALKDYNDHIAEIANKLVAIMESMMEMCLTKWEVKPPMPSQCFRNISKQTAKLHEAICDLLPLDQVTDLFRRIHKSFLVFLRLQLIRHGVSNDCGPQHGLVVADITFYMGSMRSLAGLADLESNLDDIWDKR